jgi:hypothetical protein
VKRMTAEADDRVFDVINQMESMEIRASIPRIKRWVRNAWKGDTKFVEGEWPESEMAAKYQSE